MHKFTGLLEDNRSERKKEKDFKHEELDRGITGEYTTRAKANTVKAINATSIII